MNGDIFAHAPMAVMEMFTDAPVAWFVIAALWLFAAKYLQKQ